jgi:hypothetical protein
MNARTVVTDFEGLAEIKMQRFHIDCNRYRLRVVTAAEDITVIVYDGEASQSC